MMTDVHSGRPENQNDAGPDNRIDRQLKMTKLALFAAGLPCGAYLGWSLAANDLDLSAPISPVAALAMIAVFLLANIAGWVSLSKVIDEVERQNSYKAAAFAGAAYLVGYPVWFLLWKGGFTGEPIHWLLFVLFWFSLASAAVYYRIR